MIKMILQLVDSGLEVFSEERKRQLNSELNKLIKAYRSAENARFPDYNDDALKLAKENLEAFVVSYNRQVKQGIRELKELANG